MNPDQAGQNVWPDLDSNTMKVFVDQVNFEKVLHGTKKHAKITQRANN